MFIEAKAKVPALGADPAVIDVAGRSVKITGVGIYDNIEDYPQFSFDTGGAERQRIFEGGTYQNDEGKFNQLLLHGSSTAEGKEIYFYVTPACLDPNIDPISSSSRLVTFETQQFEPLTGAEIFNPPAVDLANSNGDLPTGLYIGAIDFDIIYAYGTDPTDTNHFKLTAGADPIKIEGVNLIEGLRFRNLVTGGGGDATLSYLREF